MKTPLFTLAKDKDLDDDRLKKFIDAHSAQIGHFKQLQDAYETDYKILHEPAKPAWKPDNRIVVNFAKYIVDTMNGFFIGQPIKITADEGNEGIADYVEFLDQYNDQDDNNAELSKICSIFGYGYEMYYVDQDGNVGIIYLTPIDSFMIYDDSIIKRPREFVRLYKDDDGVLCGSVSNSTLVRYFRIEGELKWGDERIHGFDDVPATEYRENAERMGIFEPVITMIDAYNKAISEKANDVDYFADAYLKILGTVLDEDEIEHIRDDRIINFEGDIDRLVVEFLQKPNGDTTQENLIDRLEKLIFQISMVANISDENFGTSSGIALKYKLWAMSSLAKTKERKFTSGMNRRYKLIFSNPVSGMKKDDWVKLRYHFTQNFPANVLEEAQTASQLNDIVSKETQLKVLSIVDNAQDEIDKIEQENKDKQDSIMQSLFHDGNGGGNADDGGDGDGEQQ
jgi:SPP1 family phage portal protein